MAVTIDPIHQFELKTLVPLGHIGHQQLAFTQSALYMFAAVGVIALITIVATASRSVVPGRMQSLPKSSTNSSTTRSIRRPAKAAGSSCRSCSRSSCSC